jgi:hypothetical protein
MLKQDTKAAAKDLGYAQTEQLTDQVNEIGRMLNGYTRKVIAS